MVMCDTILTNDNGVKHMEAANINTNQDFIVIKALADGVNVIGMTRGKDTKFHHTEKLDKGEVMIAQFTENTSAIKIHGNAEILTAHGVTTSESGNKDEVVYK